MTTHLILVSHAPTAALRTASFPKDEPIEPRAATFPKVREEIEALGTLARGFIAPERRAAETFAALGLASPFNVAEELRDCNFGRWAGQRLSDLQEEDPESTGLWLTNPAANPHGGESIADVLKRVATWIDAQAVMGGRILAVTHPSIVRAAILHAIGAPPSAFWRINIEPLSLTDLRAHQGRWSLRSLFQARGMTC